MRNYLETIHKSVLLVSVTNIIDHNRKMKICRFQTDYLNFRKILIANDVLPVRRQVLKITSFQCFTTTLSTVNVAFRNIKMRTIQLGISIRWLFLKILKLYCKILNHTLDSFAVFYALYEYTTCTI